MAADKQGVEGLEAGEVAIVVEGMIANLAFALPALSGSRCCC